MGVFFEVCCTFLQAEFLFYLQTIKYFFDEPSSTLVVPTVYNCTKNIVSLGGAFVKRYGTQELLVRSIIQIGFNARGSCNNILVFLHVTCMY